MITTHPEMEPAEPLYPDGGWESDRPNVRREREITLRVRNDPQVLARLFTTVASCGAGILACNSYSNGTWVVVLVVTDNPLKTQRALEESGFAYATDTVVVVSAPAELGCAVRLSAQLRAAGIRILYSYTSWSDAEHACVVFKTQDDDHAIQVLENHLAAAWLQGVDQGSAPLLIENRLHRPTGSHAS
jgi:hypothetical protein